jgi:hypothetical protein
MAYDISTQLQAALDAPERYSAVFLTFVLGTDTYGFWTGAGSKEYNGITYYAGGSLIEMPDFDQDVDGSVQECSLRLSLSPEKGLTNEDGESAEDILLSFYQQAWQFGRVTIQLAALDPETLEPVGMITFIRGVIYEAPYSRSGDEHSITARVVSQGIKLSESGSIYRNAATQKRVDSSDTSLEGIGTLGGAITKQLKWNQN